MNAIVIGCGRVGSQLAYRLSSAGHKVCVVDQNEKAFANLPAGFRGRTQDGEALNQTVLHRAGIATADSLAAVTSSDMLNIAVGHVAQSVYQVKSVVVRNYDPRYRPLFEAFNLQVVSSTVWGAQRIEELLYHGEIRTVHSAGNGEVEIYEFNVPVGWNGRMLKELLPESGCCPTALTRAGRALIPTRETHLNPGDVVLVSASLEAAEVIRQRIESKEA